MRRAASMLVELVACAYGLIVAYQLAFRPMVLNDRDKAITSFVVGLMFAVGAVNLWVAARPKARAARLGRLIVTLTIVLCAVVAVPV